MAKDLIAVATLFFSYSHKDEQLRDDLEVQLTMLKREGLIESWHDRRIAAGSDLDSAISARMDTADVILLLASPDFLASEYCWGVEVKRAMERHDNGEALVVPVILRPCEWHRAPFGKLLSTPKDGRAITTWADRDEAFLDVARAVRAAIEKRTAAGGAPRSAAASLMTSSAPRVPQVRSSNLSVKKHFTQVDQDDFLVRAFEFMAEFFEGSVLELGQRNPDIAARFRRIDANRFTATAYRNGRKEAACTIWTGGEALGSVINYVSNDSAATNSLNESLQVQAGDHDLHLKAGFGTFHSERERKFSMAQAAEYLWEKFLEPLQRA